MPDTIEQQAVAAFVAAVTTVATAEALTLFVDPDRLPDDDELPALVVFTGDDELLDSHSGADTYRLRLTVSPWTVRPDPAARLRAIKPELIRALLADRTLGIASVSDVRYLGASGITVAFGEDDSDEGMAEVAAQDIDFEIVFETAEGDPFSEA